MLGERDHGVVAGQQRVLLPVASVVSINTCVFSMAGSAPCFVLNNLRGPFLHLIEAPRQLLQF